MNYYETPHKLGRPVLTGSGTPGAYDRCAVDGPFVFFHKGKWRLMHIGFDGTGYQTALAASDDLIHWTDKRVILPRDTVGGRWDSVGRAGTYMLKKSDNLYTLPTLDKVDGKYWLFYHSYPGEGYEAGPAEIGLAWCEDEDLADWHPLEKPVFSYRDGDDWDKGGLYKCWVVRHDGLFYMFYNAKDTDEGGWFEQTGLATSRDMLNWKRYENNPILPVRPGKWNQRFSSDPCVFKVQDGLIMFFYGFDGKKAQDGVAFSKDLLHWDVKDEPILTVGTGDEVDSIYAHKPCVVYHNELLYHFYCACRPHRDGDPARNFDNEFRCLSVATSKPL